MPTFDWKTIDKLQYPGFKCIKCGSDNIAYRLWESSDGAYEDYNYQCQDCDKNWWVDGIDS